MIETLDAGLGWLTAGGLIAISFVTSFITAAFGIGGGLVLLAVLASLLPAAAIIPVHGLVQLGSNGGRVWLMRGDVHWPVVSPFLLGAVAGVVLGGLIVVDLSAGVLQIVVGIFVLWSVFFKPPAFVSRSAPVAGGISSFLTMFVGGTGPFIAAFVKTMGFERMRHVATHSMLMTIQHLLKCLTFAVLGFAFATWLPLIAAMVVSGFLGTMAGKHVLMKMPEAVFKRALSAVLIVLALRLIWSGATTL